MAVHSKDIINIIVKPKPDIIRTIIEYGKIKHDLKHPETQTWYFIKGIESHKARLNDLKNDFENFRKDLNDSSLDELISWLNEIKTEDSLITGRLGLIKQIHLSYLLSKIKYIEELIEMKSRVNKVMPIDYYIENDNDFLTIAGWESEK
jgi:hypothetical protein